MRLDEFNEAPPEQVVAAVRACADVERWARQLVAGRPYPDLETLLLLCRDTAQSWTRAEVEHALSAHPRIGERPSGGGAEAAMSRSEQAAVTGADAEVRAELAQGNAAYEDRFGHVFLVRAAGRSPQDLLTELRRRLQHTHEQEREHTAANLREIAALRLETMLR